LSRFAQDEFLEGWALLQIGKVLQIFCADHLKLSSEGIVKLVNGLTSA
jgi:hypothetical protein